jgi:hypothetical protein
MTGVKDRGPGVDIDLNHPDSRVVTGLPLPEVGTLGVQNQLIDTEHVILEDAVDRK